MYKVEAGTIEELNADPLIPVFYPVPEAKMKAAVRYEIWGTSFHDSGYDFTQLRLFDTNGNNIYQIECSGY